jgi:hypothetical protein
VDAVKRIQRDHVLNRGYGDIGYHYLIDPMGRVFEGRSMEWQGAHSGNTSSGRNNNPKNVGICLLGDFEVSTPSAAAIATLDRMVAEIRQHYKLPASAIKPHSYWKDNAVPRTSHGPVAAQAVVIGALLLAIAAGACGGTEEGTTRPVEKSYPSGVVRTRGTEAYFDGKWRSHGEFVYFDEDGDETHRGAFERGLETGPWTERGADGSLGKGVYLEGERHGPWRTSTRTASTPSAAPTSAASASVNGCVSTRISARSAAGTTGTASRSACGSSGATTASRCPRRTSARARGSPRSEPEK